MKSHNLNECPYIFMRRKMSRKNVWIHPLKKKFMNIWANEYICQYPNIQKFATHWFFNKKSNSEAILCCVSIETPFKPHTLLTNTIPILSLIIKVWLDPPPYMWLCNIWTAPYKWNSFTKKGSRCDIQKHNKNTAIQVFTQPGLWLWLFHIPLIAIVKGKRWT